MPIRIPSLWAETRLAGTEKETKEKAPSSVNTSSENFLPKNMHDSYTEFVLRLTDPQVLEEYINAANGVRIGK
jgi:hypothetical protein